MACVYMYSVLLKSYLNKDIGLFTVYACEMVGDVGRPAQLDI